MSEHLAAENINLVNVRVVTNLVIAAELSEQLLVPLTAQQLIQAVNLVAVILAPAVILKQTPADVMIQAARNAGQHVINQNLVAIVLINIPAQKQTELHREHLVKENIKAALVQKADIHG